MAPRAINRHEQMPDAGTSQGTVLVNFEISTTAACSPRCNVSEKSRLASGKCHDKVASDRPDPPAMRDIQCHLAAFPTLLLPPRPQRHEPQRGKHHA